MSITPTQNLSGQDFFTTTLSSSVALSDTVINLNAVPTASEGFLVIDPNNSSTREIIYYNSKTSSSVTCPDATQGSARGIGGTTAQTHASGTAVEMRSVWEYYQYLQSGVANTGLQQYQDESTFDYVQSGLVWTADAAGSTRAASMTSGTVYIDGRRMTVSSVSGRTFTASKDTYVDVLRTGNTASLVYTEVTNNAASPALAANSIRIAIIVTGASSIATSGSINQGSPTAVLPIASSVAYSVTDSLGNLIYNTTPTPTLLGYRQITSDFSTLSVTDAQVTGLSVPVVVPTNRRVKITGFSPLFGCSTASNVSNGMTVWDGTVGSGTQLADFNLVNSSASNMRIAGGPVAVQLASGSKTYNLGARSSDNTKATVLTASSVRPSFISVELV